MIEAAAALVLESTTIITQAGIVVAVATVLDSDRLLDITTTATYQFADLSEGQAVDDECTHPSERGGTAHFCLVLVATHCSHC